MCGCSFFNSASRVSGFVAVVLGLRLGGRIGLWFTACIDPKSAIDAKPYSATALSLEEVSHMQTSTIRRRHIQVPQLPFTYAWSLGRTSAAAFGQSGGFGTQVFRALGLRVSEECFGLPNSALLACDGVDAGPRVLSLQGFGTRPP